LALQVPSGGFEQVPLPHAAFAVHLHVPETHAPLAPQSASTVHVFPVQLPLTAPLQVSMFVAQSVLTVHALAEQEPPQRPLPHWVVPAVHSQCVPWQLLFPQSENTEQTVGVHVPLLTAPWQVNPVGQSLSLPQSRSEQVLCAAPWHVVPTPQSESFLHAPLTSAAAETWKSL
jgi:hypothetical protein